MFKAVNLDFYGTLVDWMQVWSPVTERIVKDNKLAVSASALAIEWRETQRRFVEAREFTPYKDYIRMALDTVCAKYGIENKGYHNQLFAAWKDMKPFPEVPETLRALSKKAKLGICSNSAHDFTDALLAKLPAVFHQVLISDETKVNKPHPRMYALAITGFGVPKEQILHIASSQMDVKGATNAGLTVCWINRRGDKRFPDTPKPAFEIRTFDEVLTLV